MQSANPITVSISDSSQADTDLRLQPPPNLDPSPIIGILRPKAVYAGVLSRPASPLSQELEKKAGIKAQSDFDKKEGLMLRNIASLSSLPAHSATAIAERLKQANANKEGQQPASLHVSPVPFVSEDLADELEIPCETPISSPKLDSLPASPVAGRDEKKESNEAESIINDEFLVMNILRQQITKARESKIRPKLLLNDNIDAKEKTASVDLKFAYQNIKQRRRARQSMQAARLLPQQTEFEKFIAGIKEEDYASDKDKEEVSPITHRRSITLINTTDAKRDVKQEASQAKRIQRLLTKIKTQFVDEKAQLVSVDASNDVLVFHFSKIEFATKCLDFLSGKSPAIEIQGRSPDQKSLSVCSGNDTHIIDNLCEAFKISLEEPEVKEVALEDKILFCAVADFCDSKLLKLAWANESLNAPLVFCFSDAEAAMGVKDQLTAFGLEPALLSNISISVGDIDHITLMKKVRTAFDVQLETSEIVVTSSVSTRPTADAKKDAKSVPLPSASSSSAAASLATRYHKKEQAKVNWGDGLSTVGTGHLQFGNSSAALPGGFTEVRLTNSVAAYIGPPPVKESSPSSNSQPQTLVVNKQQLMNSASETGVSSRPTFGYG